jgi:peptide deformylase
LSIHFSPRSKSFWRFRQRFEDLSIPRIWSPVFRSKKITLAYQDITGKSYEKEFRKFDAIIIQHEVDHLQGILFTQRAVEQNVPLFEEKGDDLKRIEF